MPSEPRWVTPEGVVRLNLRLTAVTGEPHGLINPGGLESACDKPRNHWAYGETDMATLATALLFGIARNHPFAQGNKRTAFAAMIAFLSANEGVVIANDDVSFADDMVAVIEGTMPQEAFADRLRAMLTDV
ncbi:MAG: type II toxin-antitoxin system death-on-curing family toxin [Alphaproteobacteria bacterium]|nr:type II toxin-antitoxin system death-on-curing family toxin [Alphaproteobacteria bacterium]